MLNNLTNFFNLIRGRKIKKTLANSDLIAIGVRDSRFDGSYQPAAIKYEDFATNLATDRLVAGNREVVLADAGGVAELTFDAGAAVIQTSSPNSDLYIRTLAGDDIILQSGDDIRLEGDQGTFDQEFEGGDIRLSAGNGSDGNAANAGDGGDIVITAGIGGTSVSGINGEGGYVTIEAGYTPRTGIAGPDVYIRGGSSASGISGNVAILGIVNSWNFLLNEGCIAHPVVTLNVLPNPGFPGATAIISDSTVPALGNFGVIATGGGTNIVPVFSDGNNWFIG
jgi:hypothetical protein